MNALLDCQAILHSYFEWLKEGMSAVMLENGACLVESPFLDPHNDYIQVVIERTADGYRISDDAATLQDLAASGVDLKSEKRSQVLDVALARLGVTREGEELVVLASDTTLAAKKHSLIQAILAVSDMFYLSTAHVKSFFREDVEIFLKQQSIAHVSDLAFMGKTGLYHSFDFVFPATNGTPERLMRAINNPDKAQILDLVLAWSDTRETRSTNSRAFAILNDTDRTPSSDHLAALRNYQITPLLWSEQRRIPELIALAA